MSIKLEIPDSHLLEVKTLYEQKAKGLRDKIKELESEYFELQPILLQLGIVTPINQQSDILPNTLMEVYKSTWTWVKKCKHVIQKKGACTSKQIIEDILIREPQTSKELISRSVPATLSAGATSETPEFTRIKNDESEYVYDIKK